ncbi:MAG: hypothetical protein HY985_15090, partial [Magnetospirillum sp.]|nr:hypothetical protein [Magnetospirillum sp.]
ETTPTTGETTPTTGETTPTTGETGVTIHLTDGDNVTLLGVAADQVTSDWFIA